jgi:hypothetical protein
VSPDELLQRGRDNYRTGHYDEAAKDLSAAGDALLTPEAMQAYINSGNFSGLGQFETAMVYLALSDAKLGRDADARDAVHRIAAAERIQGVYAALPLEADAADFPAVAARVAPAMTLPSNTALAQLATGTPSTQVAETTPPPAPPPAPAAVVAEVAPAAPPAPAPEPAAAPAVPTAPAITQEPATVATPVDTTPKLAVQPTLPEQRAQTEAEIAEARAAAQRAADARIAQEREAAQRAANEQIASARAETEKSAAEKIAAAQRESEERVAQERAAAEKSAAEKVAAAQRESEQRVAQERAAAEQAAAEKIAAAQRESEQRVAQERQAAQQAAEVKIAAAQAAAQKETEARVAQEREAAQRRAEQQIADARAAAERETAQRIAAAEAAARQNLLASLRQAQAYANSGQVDDANRIYLALLNGPNPSRELLAAAGTGLYRTGSFKNAADAFHRLGTFARGEEDLRYYNAVALFETGQYDAAKKELACALPYIQVTTDVARYRAKIEQMAGQQAAR